jgi:hypothetical protein
MTHPTDKDPVNMRANLKAWAEEYDYLEVLERWDELEARVVALTDAGNDLAGFIDEDYELAGSIDVVEHWKRLAVGGDPE